MLSNNMLALGASPGSQSLKAKVTNHPRSATFARISAIVAFLPIGSQSPMPKNSNSSADKTRILNKLADVLFGGNAPAADSLVQRHGRRTNHITDFNSLVESGTAKPSVRLQGFPPTIPNLTSLFLLRNIQLLEIRVGERGSEPVALVEVKPTQAITAERWSL